MKTRLLLVSLCCFLTTVAVACPYLGSTYTDSDGTWSIDNYCEPTQAAVGSRLSTLSYYRYQSYTAPIGAISGTAPAGTSFLIVYLYPVGSYHLALIWLSPATSCPDTDSDGTKDACDACPDDPNKTASQVAVYLVPNGKICGSLRVGAKLFYSGESCGYSKTGCTGDPTYEPAEGLTAGQMLTCCGTSGSIAEDCVVDEQCVAHKGNVCTCPDGTKDCQKCSDGKCQCPDVDNDGIPDSPCTQCKKSGCICPDDDFDGQPDASCLSCQDTDGDGITDDADPDVNHPNDPGGTGDPDVPGNRPGDPNDPADPGDEPPPPNDIADELPDTLSLAGCEVDITDFKKFWTSGDSFPFNWFYAFIAMISSLFRGTVEVPQLLFSHDLPGHMGAMGIPVDFSALSVIATVSRWSIIVVYCWHVGPYMLKRYKSLVGAK